MYTCVLLCGVCVCVCVCVCVYVRACANAVYVCVCFALMPRRQNLTVLWRLLTRTITNPNTYRRSLAPPSISLNFLKKLATSRVMNMISTGHQRCVPTVLSDYLLA